jgi:hypothetical protein
MRKLYYFQAPNFDINPDSETAPKLGSIFSALNTLTAPLNQNDHVSVPENLKNQSACAGFNETVTQNVEVKAELRANLAQGIAGFAGLIYTFTRDKQNIYSCELLETLEFAPTQEFVAECITASQRVQFFLENSIMGRKRVYMVTGLKIATGFAKSSTTEAQHNPKVKVKVADATLAGVLGEAGPELDLRLANTQAVAHGRTSNRIVFAYRVIRIKPRWDGMPQYKHIRGGKYAVGENSDESEDEENKWELKPLDDEDRLKDFPDSVRVKIEGEGRPGGDVAL